MSAAAIEPAPVLPDYLTDNTAILKDTAEWRYGKAPDYTNTRAEYERTKRMNHKAGSLENLVENLVKNWEVEASFKPQLSDWRTIDHANYTFAINGGPPQPAEHMLKVGTYNAIVASNEFYSPTANDFASSHKTFKRMMPTFAWEVMEVYSGPPRVAFKWRHWGQMKNDYVGFNDKGEKITAKAHGGLINIEGVTVAQVDEAVRLQKVETWFDPLEMFRQIAPNGIVNKVVQGSNQLEGGDVGVKEEVKRWNGITALPNSSEKSGDDVAAISQAEMQKSKESIANGIAQGELEKPGNAIAAAPDSEETQLAHEMMGSNSSGECPFLMNKE